MVGNVKSLLHQNLYMLKHIVSCFCVYIACRDLKPENLLLTSKDDDANLKICDFGFAVTCDGNNIRDQLGTPGYMAPEILKAQAYGKFNFDAWRKYCVLLWA
jgi:serine/threonine protein kinase